MTQTELSIYDKRQVAAHEAGHATVAAAMKRFPIRAYLIQNLPGASDRGEKWWKGRTELTGQQSAVVAVAGVVAEFMFACEGIDTLEEIMEAWIDGWIEPSPTDMAMIPAGAGPQRRAVKKAFAILSKQKPLFDRIFAELMEGELVTDGMVESFAKNLLVNAAR